MSNWGQSWVLRRFGEPRRLMRTRRILLVVVLALLGVAALRDLSRLGDAAPLHRLYDFQDFYCAGTALDERGDPYRYEPLHRCEHSVNTTPGYRSDPNRVVPAPVPPYDLPPFAFVAHLDFGTARVLMATAIIAMFLLAVAGLALSGVPLDIAALALAFPAGYLLLDAGQIVPFALVALVWCGVALRRGNDVLAGVLGTLVAIEPHLGLPVVVALLVAVPRSRIAVIVTAICLAIVGEIATGNAIFSEYLFRVLPAQAGAETSYLYQYSLTYVLSTAHVPAPLALALGDLSYALTAVLGIAWGRRLAIHVGQRALIVFIPAATILLGGSYMHMIDLAMAVPAAALLSVSLPARSRAAAAIAVVLLSVPWIGVWITKKLFLAALFVVAVLSARLLGGVAAFALVAIVAITIYGFELRPPAGFAATTPPVAPDDLAQTAWAAYAAQLHSDAWAWLAIKVPTWCALIGIVAVAARDEAPTHTS
jgi:hypothetical protein